MNQPARILVVDDEPSIVELLAEYLRARGHEVVIAGNGEVALDRLERGGVDVVLTDMKMPELGGLELLSRIRERGYPVATILMTGYGTIDSAIRAMKDGAQDYLLKPFKLREVHAAIARAIERVRLERETVRLRQVVALYEAVHALEAPAGLVGVYQRLAEAANLEFEGDGGMLAFLEPGAGRWVPYAVTQPGAFSGFDLEAAGAAVLGVASPESPWIDRQQVHLAAPVRAHVIPDQPASVVGLVVVAGPRRLPPDAASALQVYASIVGDALTRQLLASRLLAEQGRPLLDFTGDVEAAARHLPRVGNLVERVAASLDLDRDQTRAAVAATRLLDLHRQRIRLRDLQSETPPAFLAGQLPDDALSPAWAVLRDAVERHDGYGPRQVGGSGLQAVASLLALVDHWVHLTETRRYAPTLPHPRARKAVEQEAEGRFHPDLTRRFLALLG